MEGSKEREKDKGNTVNRNKVKHTQIKEYLAFSTDSSRVPM
jgi:hypothetical protein